MRRILPVIWLACVLVGSSPTVRAQWSGTTADQMISFDDNKYARAVQIAYNDATGSLHAFWSEDAPSVREIHYGRSLDHGLTWSCTTADRVISFPDGKAINPEQCAVAVYPGAQPFLVVVWSEEVDATREVHYGISTDDGPTWSSETADRILSDPASAVNTNTPSVACDGQGGIHVVWHQTPAGGGLAEIHYSRSLDRGATWSGLAGDRMISFPDGNAAIDPQIVVGREGRLVVVWRENGESGRASIHMGYSDDRGLTWTSEASDREISQPGGLMTALAAASETRYGRGIHVVYRVSYNVSSPYYYEIYATSSIDNGASWTGEAGLIAVSYDEGAGRSASNPDVFAGPSQGVIAVWDEELDGAGTKEQHISRMIGGSWTGATQDEIISFPDGENGYRPSIAGVLETAHIPLDNPYDTFVAWTEFAGDATDNYEVHFSGATLIVNAVGDFAGAARPVLRIFPNPTSGPARLSWSIPGSGPARVEILDLSGRIILRRRVSAAGGPGTLDWDGTDGGGRPLPPGIYLVRAESPSGTASGKLIRIP